MKARSLSADDEEGVQARFQAPRSLGSVLAVLVAQEAFVQDRLLPLLSDCNLSLHCPHFRIYSSCVRSSAVHGRVHQPCQCNDVC